MSTIDLFFQGEGLEDINYLEIDLEFTFGALKALVHEKHGIPLDVLVFVEDKGEPVSEDALVKDYVTATGIKVHFHRIREVKVLVTFNGKTVEGLFSPATTVAGVRRWAAVSEFGMNEDEVGEHVLQIAGTHDRPSLDTHVGALGDGKRAVAFDLVADERVQGARGYLG